MIVVIYLTLIVVWYCLFFLLVHLCDLFCYICCVTFIPICCCAHIWYCWCCEYCGVTDDTRPHCWLMWCWWLPFPFIDLGILYIDVFLFVTAHYWPVVTIVLLLCYWPFIPIVSIIVDCVHWPELISVWYCWLYCNSIYSDVILCCCIDWPQSRHLFDDDGLFDHVIKYSSLRFYVVCCWFCIQSGLLLHSITIRFYDFFVLISQVAIHDFDGFTFKFWFRWFWIRYIFFCDLWLCDRVIVHSDLLSIHSHCYLLIIDWPIRYWLFYLPCWWYSLPLLTGPPPPTHGDTWPLTPVTRYCWRCSVSSGLPHGVVTLTMLHYYLLLFPDDVGVAIISHYSCCWCPSVVEYCCCSVILLICYCLPVILPAEAAAFGPAWPERAPVGRQAHSDDADADERGVRRLTASGPTFPRWLTDDWALLWAVVKVTRCAPATWPGGDWRAMTGMARRGDWRGGQASPPGEKNQQAGSGERWWLSTTARGDNRMTWYDCWWSGRRHSPVESLMLVDGGSGAFRPRTLTTDGDGGRWRYGAPWLLTGIVFVSFDAATFW